MVVNRLFKYIQEQKKRGIKEKYLRKKRELKKKKKREKSTKRKIQTCFGTKQRTGHNNNQQQQQQTVREKQNRQTAPKKKKTHIQTMMNSLQFECLSVLNTLHFICYVHIRINQPMTTKCR